MEKKTASGTMLTLLLISMFSLAFNIQPVKAEPFTDDFNTPTLDARWIMVDPSGGSTFDLTANPGWLRISTTSPPGRNLRLPESLQLWNAPRLMQTSIGDFVIETKVLATFDENIRAAGILAWKDANNFIAIARMSGTFPFPPPWPMVWQGVVSWGWTPQCGWGGFNPASINPTYLRIQKTGNMFSTYYSADGVVWNHHSDTVFPVGDFIYIGLVVINDYHSGVFSADFDYFRVTTAPLQSTVDIDPETLNLRSRGQWITAYIQLPDGYNAADINASTVLLNGTISPVLDPKYGFVTNSSEYLVDHNNDGILERMVKFDRATVETFINNEGISYGNVALTITGKLLDGTPLEGTDLIFVNKPFRLYYRR